MSSIRFKQHITSSLYLSPLVFGRFGSKGIGIACLLCAVRAQHYLHQMGDFHNVLCHHSPMSSSEVY